MWGKGNGWVCGCDEAGRGPLAGPVVAAALSFTSLSVAHDVARSSGVDDSKVLEEAERSLHDALCVVRCLVHKRFLITGGGSPEMEANYHLSQWSKTLMVGCFYLFFNLKSVPDSTKIIYRFKLNLRTITFEKNHQCRVAIVISQILARDDSQRLEVATINAEFV
jgi:hypothetical protein